MGAADEAPGGVSSAAPTRTRLTECAGKGVHLRPRSPDAVTIRWYGATRDTARVQAWTCPRCLPETEYELCVLGGSWFIRRSRGRETVYETVRDTREATVALWHELVDGVAR